MKRNAKQQRKMPGSGEISLSVGGCSIPSILDMVCLKRITRASQHDVFRVCCASIGLFTPEIIFLLFERILIGISSNLRLKKPFENYAQVKFL